METRFYVLLNVRTAKGLETFAKFELGTDKETAYTIFGELHGASDVNEKDTLMMELMESKNSLPYNLKIISCTLDQLTQNCRYLTKEIFKKANLL